MQAPRPILQAIVLRSIHAPKRTYGASQFLGTFFLKFSLGTARCDLVIKSYFQLYAKVLSIIYHLLYTLNYVMQI